MTPLIILQKAVILLIEATEEDKNKNYEKALPLYVHGVKFLMYTLIYAIENERVGEILCVKCRQYIDRAEKISVYLGKNCMTKSGKYVTLNSKNEVEMSNSDSDSNDPEKKNLQGKFCCWKI